MKKTAMLCLIVGLTGCGSTAPLVKHDVVCGSQRLRLEIQPGASSATVEEFLADLKHYCPALVSNKLAIIERSGSRTVTLSAKHATNQNPFSEEAIPTVKLALLKDVVNTEPRWLIYYDMSDWVFDVPIRKTLPQKENFR